MGHQLAVVGVAQPPAVSRAMTNEELTALCADMSARLRSAEHRVSDLEAETKELRDQRTKLLVGAVMILGGAVTGLVLYIFKRLHPL